MEFSKTTITKDGSEFSALLETVWINWKSFRMICMAFLDFNIVLYTFLSLTNLGSSCGTEFKQVVGIFLCQ